MATNITTSHKTGVTDVSKANNDNDHYYNDNAEEKGQETERCLRGKS